MSQGRHSVAQAPPILHCNNKWNIVLVDAELALHGATMFKSLKCLRTGHLFVDSRSRPGTQVCVRCKYRKPFEGLTTPQDSGAETPPRVADARG